MTESTSTGRRRRRSTRISQRLESARERNAAQLAAQREREQRVEQALHDFIEAGDAIATEETSCEEKVAGLQRRIDELRAETQTKVSDQHFRQARAALTIHEAGRTVDQVADLLELRSEKEARRMIAAGRETSEQEASDTRSDPESDTANEQATEQAAQLGGDPLRTGSGERHQLGWDDGRQQRSESGFIPPGVADGGSQNTRAHGTRMRRDRPDP